MAVSLLAKYKRGLVFFEPGSFLAGEKLRRQSSDASLTRFGELSRCFCVGAGPSLDAVDLSQVRNSTVVLLNRSITRHADFEGRGNALFWFCQDVKLMWHLFEDVPEGIPKILSAHKYVNLRDLHKRFNPALDIFLQPRPCFRDPARLDSSRASTPSIWPELFLDVEPSRYHWDCRKRFRVAPSSVMFAAIFFAMHFNFREIIALGMDLPDSNANYHYAEGCFHTHRHDHFSRNLTDRCLVHLTELAVYRKVSLLNASPLTSSHVLPVVQDISALPRC